MFIRIAMKISQTNKSYISSHVDGHVNSNKVKKSSSPSAAPPAHSSSSTTAQHRNWITIHVWLPFPVSLHPLSWCLLSRITGKEYMGRSQFKHVAVFEIHFIDHSVFIVYAEPCIHFPTPILLTQEDIHTLLINSGRTDPLKLYSHLSKTKAVLQSPLCWDEFSWVCNSCGHSLHSSLSFMSTWLVPWAFFHCRGLSISHKHMMLKNSSGIISNCFTDYS